MLVTDEMVETALGILFPLNAAFNEGAHERLKAKIRSALEAALSHAARQEAPINPAEIDRKLVGGEAVAVVENRFGDHEAFAERELRVLIDIQKLPIGTNFYLTPAQPPASAEVGGTNCKRFDVYERVVWTSKLGTKFCGAVRHINAPEPLSYFVDLDDGTSVQRAMPSDLASSGRKGDEMP